MRKLFVVLILIFIPVFIAVRMMYFYYDSNLKENIPLLGAGKHDIFQLFDFGLGA